MKKLRGARFPAAALLLLPVLLTVFSKDAADAARAGLSLSLHTAIPALFPFFVAGSLLTRSGLAETLGRALTRPMWTLYGLSGSCAAPLLLGLAGGYPVGAQAACDLYREQVISKQDAERLLGFCNNSGAAFIIGVVGTAVCGSAGTGAMLYAIHAVSALLCGIALTPAPPKGAPRPVSRTACAPAQPLSAAFVCAVRDSFAVCMNVTAFITIFSVLLALLRRTGVLALLCGVLAPPLARLGVPAAAADALLRGCVELTCGVTALPALCPSPRILLPLLSFLLGFGGLSVHCQTLSLVRAGGLSARRLLPAKLLHGATAAALCAIWCCAAPQSVPVFAAANLAPLASALPGVAVLSAIVLLLFLKNTGKTRTNRL